MATVGSLFINVKARTASFSKKMMGVRRTIGRMARGFGRLAMKVGKFAAILGGIALVALIAMTVKGLKAVDTMAKLAKNIGTSVKAIQVLRHMATLGGVSIEKMDKSVAKMVKNIGESAMGIGTATDALKELGLKATDLERMSPEVMFGVLADAINKLPTAARRASVAYDLMGRAGQELLVTMKDGSAGVTAMTKKLEEFGVLIGDKQANLVEQANDAWADLGIMWAGLANQLAVQLAPALTEIANRLRNMIVTAGGMGDVAEIVVLAIARMGAAAWNTMGRIHSGWLKLQGSIIAGSAQVLEWWGKIGEIGVDVLNKTVWITNLMPDAKTAQDMATELFEMAGQKLFEADAFLPIDDIARRLKELTDKFLEKGLDLESGTFDVDIINLDELSKGFKGAAESLSTAIGSMKVEGDAQNRILEQTLQTDKKHLQTSVAMLRVLQRGGTALV